MKMKALISIILFSFVSLTAFTQDYNYSVIRTNGTNKYLRKGTTEWMPMKVGTGLMKEDKILVGEGGYVYLIGDGTAEFKSPGEKSLDKIPESEDMGLAKKYLGYVMSKMSPEEQERNRKKYASVTGATERGFNAINLFMKSSSPVYNSEVVIRWNEIGSGMRYKITLEDLFEDVIKELESDENYITIKLDDEDLSSHQLISIRVNVLDDEGITSEKYSIQRINKDEFGKYKADMEQLLAVLDRNSPMSHLIMAEFYEGHNLLMDAATCYEHAVMNSSGVEYFEQAYIQFLMRNGWSEVL